MSPKPNLWQMLCSVLAAFFGVQSSHNLQRDFSSGHALTYFLLGAAVLVGFVAFVIFLITLALSLAGA